MLDLLTVTKSKYLKYMAYVSHVTTWVSVEKLNVTSKKINKYILAYNNLTLLSY